MLEAENTTVYSFKYVDYGYETQKPVFVCQQNGKTRVEFFQFCTDKNKQNVTNPPYKRQNIPSIAF